MRNLNKPKDTTKREDTMNHRITVTRPTLPPEEYEKRMAAIKQAAVDLVIATERCKAERNIKK